MTTLITKGVMNKLLLFAHFLFSYFVSSYPGLVEGNHHHHGHGQNSGRKLFVFGDSYADTGNWDKTTTASCWKLPYGITYPGKPAGRFSDGRILTDYVASYLKIRTPTPYEESKLLRGREKINKMRFGVNMAYGGTGVFNTDVSRPNMTTQTDIFEGLIKQSPKLYTKADLLSSVALVTLGGNDYLHYLMHGSNLSLPEFTKSVVNQLVVNLKRIKDLGVPKIAVMTTEPMGCVPAITYLYNYQNCSQTLNDATSYHNQLLLQSVQSLNNYTKQAPFIILDLYGAFLSALDRHQVQAGNSTYGNPLRPCCVGTTNDYHCGSVEGGEPKYTVCEEPNLAFFWDKVHPTQRGWYQVYLAIQPALKRLF